MSEELTEKRIADALERIAQALETVADKPQWVKVAEEVIGEVKKIEQKAPVVDKPAPEPVKEIAVMETVEEVTETIQENSLVGQTVLIVGGDHDGKIGVCTKKMRAWAIVEVDGEQLSVRPSHLRLQDEDVNDAIAEKVEEVATMPPTESATEVEEIGEPPSEVASHVDNFVIQSGKHAGKTIHTLYEESSLGSKTVVWMAKNHNLADHKEAAISYLKAKGVEY
tara:strand:+ start:25276 stop:25947 length:672 start_codon:yes stop_codon:yes gene_type:complete